MEFKELFAMVRFPMDAGHLQVFAKSAGDVNQIDPLSGWTLLGQACEHQNFDVIRVLKDLGADPNIQCDFDGWTALHHAVDIDIDGVWQRVNDSSFVEHLTFETTRLVLDMGGDPSICTHDGRTPRDIAEGYGVADKYEQLVGGVNRETAPESP